MPITVRLLNRLDSAEVVVHASWWSRMFCREPIPQIAVHDRWGWRWESGGDPIINQDIVRALDRALKKARGY